jgi:hypothetical protein
MKLRYLGLVSVVFLAACWRSSCEFDLVTHVAPGEPCTDALFEVCDAPADMCCQTSASSEFICAASEECRLSREGESCRFGSCEGDLVCVGVCRLPDAGQSADGGDAGEFDAGEFDAADFDAGDFDGGDRFDAGDGAAEPMRDDGSVDGSALDARIDEPDASVIDASSG